MGQITLRGLSPDVEEQIRKKAKQEGKSINKFISEIIGKNEQLQKSKKKTKAHSLKRLSGGWSREEADQFLNSLQFLEPVDEDPWK